MKVELETQGKQGAYSDLLAMSNLKAKSEFNTENLLERIVDKRNIYEAYKKVVANKGNHGVDGMKVDELLPFLQEHYESLKARLLSGKYKPQPVRRVEIPKPNGGVRLLGIPTGVDRLIQQATNQVLNPILDREFSNSSYGFRPRRNAHMALKQAQTYINEGYKYVVDMDLEKFLDNVNHDLLMHLVARKIEDKRLLKLIRKYLNFGIMLKGMLIKSEEGTPQGGLLSPLLSNILLDELDKWIRRRLRAVVWKTWKLVGTRFKNLMKLGVPRDIAWQFANTRKGYWRISKSHILNKTITNQRLINHGFKSLSSQYEKFRPS